MYVVRAFQLGKFVYFQRLQKINFLIKREANTIFLK